MNTESTVERVLAVLEDDAKASYATIAERVGVSKPTVRKYVRQLEDDGVIVGYSADVDPKKLASQTIALVGVDAESERYVEVSRELKGVPGVKSLYTATGDHMMMVEMRAENGDALGDRIRDHILTIDGVTAAHPCFLQERLK